MVISYPGHGCATMRNSVAGTWPHNAVPAIYSSWRVLPDHVTTKVAVWMMLAS